MTYDPDRDARAPADVNPNTRPYERGGAGLSVALMLGLMAAFVLLAQRNQGRHRRDRQSSQCGTDHHRRSAAGPSTARDADPAVGADAAPVRGRGRRC